MKKSRIESEVKVPQTNAILEFHKLKDRLNLTKDELLNLTMLNPKVADISGLLVDRNIENEQKRFYSRNEFEQKKELEKELEIKGICRMAKKYGFNKSTVYRRMALGWDILDVFTIPARGK